MQTYQEIEDIVDTEIAAKPELEGLTSSNAAEWKLWKSVYIYAAMSLQFLWEQFKAEVLALLKVGKLGRPEWYVSQAKSFQFGHDLLNNDGILTYEIDDADARIITQAAAVAKNGIVLIKVATASGVLSTEQRAAFIDYWDAVKPFAQPLQVISEQPDKVKAVMVINYDGKLLESVVQETTEAAINSYLTTKVGFNGDFNINRFRDTIEEALRALSDECDVNIENVQIRTTSGTYINVAYKYTPLSGRYLFGFPNDATPTDRSTITYVRI